MGALTLLCGAALRGSDLPAPFTLDLPVAASQELPDWLGHPETPEASFAELELPILTPDPSASLLVTVYFYEKQDGFMRIAWQGTQGSQVLSGNFYEGIGMSNQRSLLLSPVTLLGDGVLTFQCGDSSLGIRRIKLEWLETKESLVSSQVQDVLVTPAIGFTQPALSLNGQPKPAEAAAWQDSVVTVPLLDLAQRIEQGVEFSVDLDEVPGTARLVMKETGLPMGKHLVVWINQARAGTITPPVPDLLDGGFVEGSKAGSSYVGWRDATFYVPVKILRTGDNAVQFSMEDDIPPASGNTLDTATPTSDSLAIKDLDLQLNYPPKPAVSPAAAVPQIVDDSTGPISPASADAVSTSTPTSPP